MATYTRLAAANSFAYWQTIFQSTSVSASFTIALSDGTELLLGGSGLTVNAGVLTGGTINTITHRTTTFTILETINGLSYQAPTFQGFLNTGDGIGLQSSLMSGNDAVIGSVNPDVLFGGNGDDNLRGLAGNDTINGGNGSFDEVRYDQDAAAGGSAAVNVNLATGSATDGFGNTDVLIGIEGVRGTAQADTLTGSSGNNFFYGLGGADVIDGGAGVNDMARYDLDGGSNGIRANLSAGQATVGGVVLQAGQIRDGFLAIDQVTGIEEVRGTANADFFLGSAGYNFFQGRAGADTYDGGNSVAYTNNSYTALQPNWNWVDYRQDGGASGIVLTFTNGTALPGAAGVGHTAGSGTDTFGATETFTDINAVRGSMLGDTVTGNSFFNYFEGLSGADVFNGGAGQDRYSYSSEIQYGGSTTSGVIVNLTQASVTVGANTVAANHGLDTFGFLDTFGTVVAGGVTITDVEEIKGTDQADYFFGGAADNNFFGLGGNDHFVLGDGFDYVEPDAGNDVIDGTPATPGLDQSYEDRDMISYDNYGGNGVGLYIDLNLGTLVDPTGGTDTFTDMERVRGTIANDTIIGSDTQNQREELFQGLAGNDLIDGRGGYNIVDYTRDEQYADRNGVFGTQGIIANLSAAAITVGGHTVAAGTIRDGFGDTDTVYYIQGVRGTEFADTFVGDDARNIFRVINGADHLDGGGGNDAVDMYMGDYFGSEGTGAVVDLTLGTARAAYLAGAPVGDVSTLVSIEDIAGSSLADTLTGDAGNNQITGWFGDDVINGLGGNDTIGGGEGADVMDGGDGFDVVTYLFDPTIDDYFIKEFPQYFTTQWTGVKVNLSNAAANLGGTLVSAGKAVAPDGKIDTLSHFEGVVGSFYDDFILGDAGDNTFWGATGNDTIDGGDGIDTISYANYNSDGRVLVPILGINASAPIGLRINLTGTAQTLGGVSVAAGHAIVTSDGAVAGGEDTLSHIENIVGTTGADFIMGTAGSAANDGVDNLLDGGAGTDRVVYAGASGDYSLTQLNGQGVWQVIHTATGDVNLLRNIEEVEFLGGGGVVPLAATSLNIVASGDVTGANGNDTLTAAAGAAIIDGGAGNDSITGSSAGDELTGGDGNDVVNAGAGNDLIVAGSGQGNDTYSGGPGIDELKYTSTSHGIIVDLATSVVGGVVHGTAVSADPVNFNEIDTDDITGIENVIAGSGNDQVYGDTIDNEFFGEAGDDTLDGRSGNDTLHGGSGNDHLFGGIGDDKLFGDSNDDTLKGGAGNDLIDGGANSLTGVDTAVYDGAHTQYQFTRQSDGSFVVQDLRTGSPDGTDTLTNIEQYQFADGTLTADQLTGHYTSPTIALHSFGVSDAAGGWVNDNRYHREVGDVNGDGYADLVGFGGDSTFVALSDGSGGFANPIAAINSFGYSDLGGGWGTNDLFPRTVADVNGDHKADIVGFGSAGVWVGIANGDGTFTAPTLKLASFGTDAAAGSWTNNTIYHREVADVNGDGMADVVGFGSSGTYVALATGGGNFANPILGLNSFGYAPDGGSWQTNDVYPRTLADVNGDGMADLIGFGDAGIWIATATGAGHFASPQLVLHSFGASQDAGGWSSDNVFHREVADVDGDGYADIVGFGGVGAYVALGLGNGSFANPELEVNSFGYTNDGGGWGTNGVFPRTLANVSGDHAAELIGFGDAGVWTSHWTTV